jgi:hypothetical protein
MVMLPRDAGSPHSIDGDGVAAVEPAAAEVGREGEAGAREELDTAVGLAAVRLEAERQYAGAAGSNFMRAAFCLIVNGRTV